jgi:hypothetical protein
VDKPQLIPKFKSRNMLKLLHQWMEFPYFFLLLTFDAKDQCALYVLKKYYIMVSSEHTIMSYYMSIRKTHWLANFYFCFPTKTKMIKICLFDIYSPPRM